MAAVSPQYRVEPRFKEILAFSAPHHLTIRQVSDGRFMICAPHESPDMEYVLSTARSPKVPKFYSNVGRAIQFAHSLSGLICFHVELSNEADPDALSA